MSENFNKWLHIRHIHGNYVSTAKKILYTKLIQKQAKVEYHVVINKRCFEPGIIYLKLGRQQSWE
jgi:hypothetical protein